MSTSDYPTKTNRAPSPGAISWDETPPDVVPPIGTTPPQVLAEDAAAGRRGAAWRLLYWIMENDPRAVEAVASLEDDRLARNLLEFIALRTWAGKPFVVPPPLRTAYARTRLRTLFLPSSGMDAGHADRVLLAAVRDQREVMRETAVHILGIIASPVATPALLDALRDPASSVRLQAAKAAGRVGDPAAVPALINALQGADEQMSSQVFSALAQLGSAAVPALIEASTSRSPWIRWNCIRALSAIPDRRCLPVLVKALRDGDHGVAWMAAKGLVHGGRRSIEPVLRTLMAGDITSWLAETASFALNSQHHPQVRPYLEPVIQELRGTSYKTTVPPLAQKVLTQLLADKVIEPAEEGKN